MNKLSLSKELYSETLVRQSVEAFAQIADINIIISSKYYICDFLNSKYSLNETIKEFENYLIDLTNHLKKYDNN